MKSINYDPWNKGLTAETDIRVAKLANQNKRIGTHDPLESELSDDGKLFIKYCAKKSNAKLAGVQCTLTFHEYCLLVQQAGLKSSDLGYSGNGYDLARYNDSGDYTFDNCRFITHSENAKERKLSDAMKNSLKKAIEASSKSCKNDPTRRRDAIKSGICSSKKCQEMHQRSLEKLAEYESSKDPRRSGVHNSSYGTHWITDGVNNRKWCPDEEPEIPEGWRLGRVMNN